MTRPRVRKAAAGILFLAVLMAVPWLKVLLRERRVRAAPGSIDVVLLTLDTTRADRLGCYGSRDVATPNLDRLARSGVLFRTAYAHVPLTCPSHASILTGLSPSEHGVSRTRPDLGEDLPTLPELLRKVGYRTVGISSSYWVSAATGFDRGFDVFIHSWQRCQAWTNTPLERQQRRDPSHAPTRCIGELWFRARLRPSFC